MEKSLGAHPACSKIMPFYFSPSFEIWKFWLILSKKKKDPSLFDLSHCGGHKFCLLPSWDHLPRGWRGGGEPSPSALTWPRVRQCGSGDKLGYLAGTLAILCAHCSLKSQHLSFSWTQPMWLIPCQGSVTALKWWQICGEVNVQMGWGWAGRAAECTHSIHLLWTHRNISSDLIS